MRKTEGVTKKIWSFYIFYDQDAMCGSPMAIVPNARKGFKGFGFGRCRPER